MTQVWQTLECVETPDGPLELRRRGQDDFLITVRGRVLMNSHANRSELAGPTFSPDGQTLFLNIQRPGATYAIWGPWEEGAL